MFLTILYPYQTAKGGYVPPITVESKIKPKDEDILKEVIEIIEELEATHAPKELKAEAKAVKAKVKKASTLKTDRIKTQRLKETQTQIKALSKELNNHIKYLQEDEDAAIQAILEVM